MIFREKPRIDEFNIETSETQKETLKALTPVNDFLAKYGFQLFSRKLSHFQVEMKYKKGNDIIIIYFYYFPIEYPDWFALVVLSTKNKLKRIYVPLKGLRKPEKLLKENLEYRIIQHGAVKIGKKDLENTVHEIQNDLINYAEDFLKGDYTKIQEDYSNNKKIYSKNYSAMF